MISFSRDSPPLYHQDDPMCAFLAQLGILPIPFPLYDPFQEAELALAKGYFQTDVPSKVLESILKTPSFLNDSGPLYYTNGFGMKIEPSRRLNAWNLVRPAWTTMAFSNDLKEGQIPGSDLSLIAAFQSQIVPEEESKPGKVSDSKVGRVSIFGSSYFLSCPSFL